MIKRIIQLLLSLAIVACLAYIALGYEGRREAEVGIATLSLLAVACVYDMLRLLLWSREYKKQPTRPKKRKVPKEIIEAAKEIWEREGRRQFQ